MVGVVALVVRRSCGCGCLTGGGNWCHRIGDGGGGGPCHHCCVGN